MTASSPIKADTSAGLSTRPALWGSSRQGRTAVFLACWAILALLLLIRLEGDPLIQDEAASILSGREGPREAWLSAEAVGRAPLFDVVTGFFHEGRILRGSQLRYLSALFVWLGFWAAYRLMRGCVRSPSAALPFCVLMATSPFWVQLGRYARPDSMFALFATTSTLFFLAGLKRPRARNWALYSFFLILALYTSGLALALVFGHVIAAMAARPAKSDAIRRRRRRGLALSWLAAALAFAPWLPALLGHTPSPPYEVLAHGGAELNYLHRAGLSCGYSIYGFLLGDAIAPWNALRGIFFCSVGLAPVCFGLARVFRDRTGQAGHALICGLASGLAAIWIVSLMFRHIAPMDMPPLLGFLFPLVCMAMAYGFGAMRKRTAIPLLTAMLAINIYGMINHYGSREHTNWAYVVPVDETMETLEAHLKPGDVLAIDGNRLSQIGYYSGTRWQYFLLGENSFPKEFPGRLVGAPRILFLFAKSNDAPRNWIEWAARNHGIDFELAESIPFATDSAANAEIRSFFTGAPASRGDYVLDIYDRVEKERETP